MVGLVASATHLGNPSNALYVFLGVGRSPLSTEVFFAVVFLALAGLYWLVRFRRAPLAARAAPVARLRHGGRGGVRGSGGGSRILPRRSCRGTRCTCSSPDFERACRRAHPRDRGVARRRGRHARRAHRARAGERGCGRVGCDTVTFCLQGAELGSIENSFVTAAQTGSFLGPDGGRVRPCWGGGRCRRRCCALARCPFVACARSGCDRSRFGGHFRHAVCRST